MIGKIMIGKSFRGCLLYCLQDKIQKGAQLQMKDRAEVLMYNKCYGSDKELIQQFHEVRLLNQKVTKPVLHVTLSLAPGEQLGKDKLMEIIEGCAKDMGFENNQYIAVVHRDTSNQHIHIVANRIGFDGHTVSDGNSYKKVALFCRKMESKYGLKPVLSPRRYLSSEHRHLPRQDGRKEQFRQHIKESLIASNSYSQFEEKMKVFGYQVLKGRGISFLDDKGVKVKGSEVGYSLLRIEQMLQQKQTFQQQNKWSQAEGSGGERLQGDRMRNQKDFEGQKLETNLDKQPAIGLGQAMDLLAGPEKQLEVINTEFLKKKRRKKNRSLHL
jgi:hypothetical protein